MEISKILKPWEIDLKTSPGENGGKDGKILWYRRETLDNKLAALVQGHYAGQQWCYKLNNDQVTDNPHWCRCRSKEEAFAICNFILEYRGYDITRTNLSSFI